MEVSEHMDGPLFLCDCDGVGHPRCVFNGKDKLSLVMFINIKFNGQCLGRVHWSLFLTN